MILCTRPPLKIKPVYTQESSKAATPNVKAPQQIIHNIYSMMPIVCGLTTAHKKHLHRTRLLQDDEMADYFSFPSANANIVPKIILGLANAIAHKHNAKNIRELSKEQLAQIDATLECFRKYFQYVPGFYYDMKARQIKYSNASGIAFLVRDDLGQVQGIQIRRDHVIANDSRYIWFSSSFARQKPTLDGGSSPGAPGGVIFPKGDSDHIPALCITEGRFKAEYIARDGNIAVYVSGVSLWKSIMPMIDRLLVSHKCQSMPYLMFDADVMGNVAVHTQLSALAEALKAKGLIPKIIVWPISRGKGFDDLMIKNGTALYKKYIKSLDFDQFEEVYNRILHNLLNGRTIRGISKEEARQFQHTLQS